MPSLIVLLSLTAMKCCQYLFSLGICDIDDVLINY
ncbi:hypothetical protein BBOH_1346 [Bifidobacterium bohemicum DSM 22767]|uniref:Uncharacterized protein n=1 Tax=Bifidobacterium bohemicum DSM 22767 TaxID=1437606 RepID=A0A086ZEY4_9BIFI|nr:hypothetical protein BBOH_1346 [Bifidobacterium bohemicum DSM 22767]